MFPSISRSLVAIVAVAMIHTLPICGAADLLDGDKVETTTHLDERTNRILLQLTSSQINTGDARARAEVVVLAFGGMDASTTNGRRVSSSGDLERFRISAAPLGDRPFVNHSFKTAVSRRALGDRWKAIVESVMTPSLRSSPSSNRILVVATRHLEKWHTRIYDRADLPKDVSAFLRELDPDESLGSPTITVAPLDSRILAERARPVAAMARMQVARPADRVLWGTGKSVTSFNAADFSRVGLLASAESGHSLIFQQSSKGHWIGLTSAGAPTFLTVRRVDAEDQFAPIELWNDERVVCIGGSNDEAQGIFVVTNKRLLRLKAGTTLETLSVFKPTHGNPLAIGPDVRRILVSRDRRASLLDPHQPEKEMSLAMDRDCDIVNATFSDDGLLVAAISHEPNGDAERPQQRVRLRVWNTQSGELIHELHAFDLLWLTVGARHFLTWDPKGEYLLASDQPQRAVQSSAIHLWNVRTGRHRAEFIGITAAPVGIGLDRSGGHLYAGTEDGRILMWKVP